MSRPRKNSRSSARAVVRSDQGSIIPSVIYSALRTIALSSQACPFPPVVVAAQLAVDIWDKVVTIRKNKAEFRNLAYTTGDVVTTVWSEVNRQIVESGTGISASFGRSVDNFLSSIRRLVCDYAARGLFRRLFCADSDLVCIAEFQQELEQAKRNFELVAIINVRATVERIEQNQRHIRGVGSPTASNVTMSNTGGGVFNNIVGNQYNDLGTTIRGGRYSEIAPSWS
ncbi:Fungal STAND N-terminal Goodbye domain-containing protein [Pleurotus pulmonarius]